MVTHGNPFRAIRQPHVTRPVAKLFCHSERAFQVKKSQSVRHTFDILKAKAKLAEAGKTYADLAKPLAYERQAVGHWFRGRGEPNVQQMKIMAKELGCHWLDLVTDDTTVIYRDDELKRVEAIRTLTAGDLAELDAFLAFKAATQVKK